MFTFTDALVLAAEAHRGKKDKGGIDYIKHPLYLYHKVKMKGGSNETQMAAILHDVIEDSAITTHNLRCSECPESIIEALNLLTHIPDEGFMNELIYNGSSKDEAIESEYLEYVRSLSHNDIARVVKIEDLRHNSDIRRLKFDKEIKEKDILRIAKYTKALAILTGGKVGYV